MKTQATKADKSRRWKPLSQTQENAIDCLLAGMTDTETAADPRVNVARQTVWEWRIEHILFRATLQQRRASLSSATFERLRGLMGQVMNNIEKAITEGDLGASFQLMKCLGMYGDGARNAVHGANIEYELENMATNQARREQDAMNDDSSMNGAMARLNFNVSARTEEILTQLIDQYADTDEG